MKTYEELQKEWNESTYGNEFAHYVYSIDKEIIERLEKENKELKEQLSRANILLIEVNAYMNAKQILSTQKLFRDQHKSTPDN